MTPECIILYLFLPVHILQDLSSQGVGLGSVHARQQFGIAQHCGVSRVPTVVGVVSGRVHHFYGQLRDKITLINFLDNILPKQAVSIVSMINIDTHSFYKS